MFSIFARSYSPAFRFISSRLRFLELRFLETLRVNEEGEKRARYVRKREYVEAFLVHGKSAFQLGNNPTRPGNTLHILCGHQLK